MSLRLSSSLLSLRFAIHGLNLALVVALGFITAYWSWQLWVLSTPSGETISASVNTKPLLSSPLLAPQTYWFGGGAGQPDRSKTTAGLKLIGTFIGTSKQPSYAIITLGSGRSLALSAGAELAKGELLQEISPDHVILKRDGVLVRLDLDRKPIPQGLIVR